MRSLTPLVNSLSVLVLTSCAGGGGCSKCEVTLVSASNYTYAGTVDIPSFETASQVGIEICFDQMTQDLQCHDLDPAADILNVGMGRFALTEEEIEQKLAEDDLQQSEATGYVEFNTTGQTCVNTADMGFLGTPIDVPKAYYEGPSYMVLLGDSTTVAVGTRMLAILHPMDDSDVTEVDVPGGCGVLDFAADLTSTTPLEVCDKKKVFVDWGEVKEDGLGNEFDPSTPTVLTLAHYTDETVEDLQENFFDLELMADELWSLSLTGEENRALLQDAQNESGDYFESFEDSGIYVLALRNTVSPNPAPSVLTILEVQ